MAADDIPAENDERGGLYESEAFEVEQIGKDAGSDFCDDFIDLVDSFIKARGAPVIAMVSRKGGDAREVVVAIARLIHSYADDLVEIFDEHVADVQDGAALSE